MVINGTWTVYGIDIYKDPDLLMFVSDLAVPYKDVDGILKDSGVVLDGTQLTSRKDIELPPNTLHLGTNLSISENGGFVEYHTNTLDKHYLLLDYENDLNLGTSDPIYWKRGVLEKNVVFQKDDTQILKDVKTVKFNVVSDGEISKFYFKFADDVTNMRFKIVINGNEVGHYPSKFAFYNSNVGGYNLKKGTQEIELVPHFSFLKAYGVITFELVSDTPINVLGFNTMPYFSVDRNQITAIPLTTTPVDLNGTIKYFGTNYRIRLENNFVWFEEQKIINYTKTWVKQMYVGSNGVKTTCVEFNDGLSSTSASRLSAKIIDLMTDRGVLLNKNFAMPIFTNRTNGISENVCLTDDGGNPYFVDVANKKHQLASVDDLKNVVGDYYGNFEANTTDFRTACDDFGSYRCFNMTGKIPQGYAQGDNDFITDYTPTGDARFERLSIKDVRSGRRFELMKVNDTWGDFIEMATNQYVIENSKDWDMIVDLDLNENIHVIKKAKGDLFEASVGMTVFTEHVDTTKDISCTFDAPVSGNTDVLMTYDGTAYNAYYNFYKLNGVDLKFDEVKSVKLELKGNVFKTSATGCATTKDGWDTWKQGYVPKIDLTMEPTILKQVDMLKGFKINPEMIDFPVPPKATMEVHSIKTDNKAKILFNDGFFKTATLSNGRGILVTFNTPMPDKNYSVYPSVNAMDKNGTIYPASTSYIKPESFIVDYMTSSGVFGSAVEFSAMVVVYK
jgi:hypothetical protein